MPARSQQQQKIMGLALAFKRGEVPASKVSQKVKDLAKSMSEKELEKYASTKHKGLPTKIKESNLATFEQFLSEKDDEFEVEDEMEFGPEGQEEIVHVASRTPMRSVGSDAPEAHDPESKMIQYQLKNIIENAEELIQMVEGLDSIEDWIQSKVTLADDYISTLRDYMKHRA